MIPRPLGRRKSTAGAAAAGTGDPLPATIADPATQLSTSPKAASASPTAARVLRESFTLDLGCAAGVGERLGGRLGGRRDLGRKCAGLALQHPPDDGWRGTAMKRADAVL